MKKGNIRHSYPGGNTCRGFHSYFDWGLKDMERVYILKGGPGTGKSTLMRKIGLAMVDRGFDVEFWQCSADYDSIDGVIITDLKMAVVDGTAPHTLDPRYPGVVEVIINLGDHWRGADLQSSKNEIKYLADEISLAYASAWDYLQEAKTAYEKWQKSNQPGMNFKQVNQKTLDLIEQVFPKENQVVRHMFSGAITAWGLINCMHNITKDCQTRYFLKGPPGSGKSTIIKKLGEEAMRRGYETEIYHAPLDPQRMDLVLIPQLKLAILDGGLIDEEIQLRGGDQVIDLWEEFDPNLVSFAPKEQTKLKDDFQQLMAEAIERLNQAKVFHDKLEGYYIKAMDFEALEERRKELLHQILSELEKGD